MITDRRSVLAGLALIAATSPAMAQETKPGDAAMPATPMKSPSEMKSAMDFYNGVLPRAELSLATSQIAVKMTTNKNALEFAGFELGEAVTVNMVLKDLGASASEMDADAASILDQVKGSAKGKDFDKHYIALQLKNHEDLRDLADAFLHDTPGATDADIKQGRHLASLMLAVFKEHVAITKRIGKELDA